jgi:hypothetical protein
MWNVWSGIGNTNRWELIHRCSQRRSSGGLKEIDLNKTKNIAAELIHSSDVQERARSGGLSSSAHPKEGGSGANTRNVLIVSAPFLRVLAFHVSAPY